MKCKNKCQAVHGKTGFWYYESNGPDSRWVKCELCSSNSSAGVEPIVGHTQDAESGDDKPSTAGRTGGSIPPTGASCEGKSIWPDEKLEREMLADADRLVQTSSSHSLDRDCAYHIKALLARVRDLEADREKFKRQVADFVDKIATQQQEEYHASQS